MVARKKFFSNKEENFCARRPAYRQGRAERIYQGKTNGRHFVLPTDSLVKNRKVKSWSGQWESNPRLDLGPATILLGLSERGESNPRILLGKQTHYHCATLAKLNGIAFCNFASLRQNGKKVTYCHYTMPASSISLSILRFM